MSNFKSFTIYSIGFLSLLLGLVLNENSSGGAKIDFNYLFPFVEGFSSDFQGGLKSYIETQKYNSFSSFLYINEFLYKIIDNVIIIKIFYIFLCSFFPFIFFFILKDKFKIDEKYFVYFFSNNFFISIF